jgi:hypothetical protein
VRRWRVIAAAPERYLPGWAAAEAAGLLRRVEPHDAGDIAGFADPGRGDISGACHGHDSTRASARGFHGGGPSAVPPL